MITPATANRWVRGVMAVLSGALLFGAVLARPATDGSREESSGWSVDYVDDTVGVG